MSTQRERKPLPRTDDDGPIVITVPENLVRRIQGVSRDVRTRIIRNWCIEAIEYILDEHRVGKYRPDPDRHTTRNGTDFTHVIDEYLGDEP